MSKATALKSLIALSLLAAAAPAPALAWTRSYVVRWIEPALHFGGPASGAQNAPGDDCPKGVNTMDWDKLLITSYRPPEKVAEIRDPEYSRPGFLSHLGFRGPNKELVYENPTVLPDPGHLMVEGKIGEGFDLDDDPKTGFTSPSGQAGVDNVFYKLVGCSDLYRGRPRDGFISKNSMEVMTETRSLVVVMSGDKDPMNDDNATFALYASVDRMMKNPDGGFLPDYSFRVDPKDQAVFKVKITDGVVETVDRPTVGFKFAARDARLKTDLYLAKARFEMKPDGSMSGMIGGYVELKKAYLEMNVSSYIIPASQSENLGHFNLVGMFYAMRRAADGLPDPVTGKMRGLSTAYRLDMIPAFVVEPKGGATVKVAQYLPQ